MLEILQGSLGSGKTSFCTARLLTHLKAGGVVATNMKLTEGWAETLADSHIISRFSPSFRTKLAKSYHERCFFVSSLAAVLKIEPRKLAIKRHREEKGVYKEGQGLLVLDEAQLIFNSRDWRSNMPWISFFTQSRKLKWDVLMVAHDLNMVDTQIRSLFEYETFFRNLKMVRIPFTPIPLSPFRLPVFLWVRKLSGLGPGSGSRDDFGLQRMPLWAFKLFDSTQLFSRDSEQFYSPLPQGKAPEAPRASDACRRGPVSRLSPDCMWSRYHRHQRSQSNARIYRLFPRPPIALHPLLPRPVPMSFGRVQMEAKSL